MSYIDNKKYIEKRKGPDILIQMIKWIVGSLWVLLFIALLLFEKAKPQIQIFFDRLNNFKPLKENWDTSLTKIIFIIMLFGLICGIIGIIFNQKRKKRKTDETWISLYFIVFISLCGILIYIF